VPQADCPRIGTTLLQCARGAPAGKRTMNTGHMNSSGTIRFLRGLIVATLVIPALLLGFATWRDRSAILEGARGDALKLMAVFNEQAENLFIGHDNILDLIVLRVHDRDWDAIQSAPGFLDELETMDKRLDDASAIMLVDASGQTRATTLHLQVDEPLPPGNQACFLALQSGTAASCVSKPYLDPVTGQHLFSLNRRLERNGRFNGMAQVAISADYIITLWASAMPRATDTISILRGDGVVLAQTASQSSGEAEPPEVPKSLIGEFDKAGSGIIQRISSPTAMIVSRCSRRSRIIRPTSPLVSTVRPSLRRGIAMSCSMGWWPLARRRGL
jgi:hypothetical protein